MLAALAALVLYILVLIPLTPSIHDLRNAKVEVPAKVLFADGKLLTEYKRSNRVWVKLDEVSPHVVNALIATEDHRFYDHHGMDLRRTAGSVIWTLMGRPQGGSTLTQQLARNLYPKEIGRSRSIHRKLKEAITAFKIEAVYSKDEILETYLNTVPFLYNAYGIEMAARTYFDKPASKLSLLESATLVGMLKGTAYYNPVLNPERATNRRNTVLGQMVKRDKLAQPEYDKLAKRPLKLDFERQPELMGPAPHFAQQLRQWLINWADANDYDLYADGLVIHTTLDSRLQTWANQAVARQGKRLQTIADQNWAKAWDVDGDLVQGLVRESEAFAKAKAEGEDAEAALARLTHDAAFMRQLKTDKTRIQLGLYAQDPRNGHVLAWVGSRGYVDDAFDHVAAARRQPGSTFKPFVYGAALQEGLKPGDTFVDEAVTIPLSGGRVWQPRDAGGPTGQTMTLADGLAYSKNTITAQVMNRVGPERVASLARALGVRESELDPVPALSLGTSPVSLQEMVQAYATLANAGQYQAMMAVTRIATRDGEVLAEFATAKPDQAWNPALNSELVDMMRGVIDKGTGRAIRSQWGLRGKLAGKTGTTQGNADGWFILMQPQMVVGAWAGFNDQRITLRSDRWGQGAQSALPAVGDLMARAQGAGLLDAKLDFPTGQGGGGIADWLAELFGKQRGEGKGSEDVPDSTPAAQRPPADPAPVVTDTQPWQGPASGESSAGMNGAPGMAPPPVASPTPLPPGPPVQTTPPPPGTGTPVGTPLNNGGFAPPVIDSGSGGAGRGAPVVNDPLPPEFSDASQVPDSTPAATVRELPPLGTRP
nr:transglycosylase domain-containing protein [Comamonas serinivorans]